VKAFQGQGGYGAVYRAERVGFRRSQPGALKMSLGWLNGRMEREVQLLSRLNHPSIPRLLDRGGRYPTKGGNHHMYHHHNRGPTIPKRIAESRYPGDR
jgi:serine/threonine protein kinase